MTEMTEAQKSFWFVTHIVVALGVIGLAGAAMMGL